MMSLRNTIASLCYASRRCDSLLSYTQEGFVLLFTSENVLFRYFEHEILFQSQPYNMFCKAHLRGKIVPGQGVHFRGLSGKPWISFLSLVYYFPFPTPCCFLKSDIYIKGTMNYSATYLYFCFNSGLEKEDMQHI